MLEAIEQHHIAPPPRPTLVRLLTQVLKTQVPKDLKKETSADRLDEGLLERLDADILQCQSANEMADVFERMEGMKPDFKRFIAKITFAYREILSKDELIRAKDHDVEDQLQGNRYVGLGINLSNNDASHLPVIMGVRPGGPADRGGLKPKTYIHEIDGRPTENVP
ncbi:MAG: PDZ domain-containing protein, partial [Schlesneria sp.]